MVVTETWLQDDSEMDELATNLEAGHGLRMLVRNRTTIAANGRKYGGVAIVSNNNKAGLQPFTLDSRKDFEVVAASTRIKGVGRVAIVGAYIPPNYTAAKAAECIEYVSDVVGSLKGKFKNCYITVAGDFNQWPIERIAAKHPDLKEVDHGPTRLDRKIDRMFVNFPNKIDRRDTLEPLEDELGNASDHRAAFLCAIFQRDRPEKCTFTYRPYNERAAQALIEKFRVMDWREVLDCVSRRPLLTRPEPIY